MNRLENRNCGNGEGRVSTGVAAVVFAEALVYAGGKYGGTNRDKLQT